MSHPFPSNIPLPLPPLTPYQQPAAQAQAAQQVYPYPPQAPQAYAPPGADKFSGVGDASSSAGGNWLEAKSEKESGIHIVKIKRLSYATSTNPQHPAGTEFFIAEGEILESNVHAKGSTKSWSVNMNHQPSKGNVKDFMFAALQSMGYTLEQIIGFVREKGQSGHSRFAEICAWLVGADNPAGRAGVTLRCESSTIITRTKRMPFTKQNWTAITQPQAAQ